MAAKKVLPRPVEPSQPEALSMEVVLINALKRAKPHLLSGLIVVIVILLVVIGVAYYNNSRKLNTANAYKELHNTLEIDLAIISDTSDLQKQAKEKREKLEELIGKYPGRPVAIEAKFHIAHVESQSGNYTNAASLFADFQQEFSDYEPMATLAQLAEANCYLANNDIETAKKKFKQIHSADNAQDKPSYVASQAMFQDALCSLLLGDSDESRNMLNEVLASESDETIEQRAQSLLAKMEIIPLEDIKSALSRSDDSEKSSDSIEIEQQENPPQNAEQTDANTEKPDQALEAEGVDSKE